MAQVTFVQGTVQWQVTEQPSGRLVAACAPLGVVLEGSDMNDLYACIKEAIQLIMTDLLNNGQLESFLIARGWRPAAALPLPGGEPISFEPPIELLLQGKARDRARAVN
jgi:hypothetical protein